MQWRPSPPDGPMREDPSADTLALWLQDTATLTGCEALAAVLRRRCAAALPGAPPPPASGPTAARITAGAPNVVGEAAAPAAALALPSTQALPTTDNTGDGGAPAPFAVEVGLADTALTGLALSQAAQHREFAEQVRGPTPAGKFCLLGADMTVGRVCTFCVLSSRPGLVRMRINHAFQVAKRLCQLAPAERDPCSMVSARRS